MQFGAKYEPVYGRGGSATIARSPAFAAHLSEVAVDTDTGARPGDLGHLAVQDVGRAINPAAVEGQIHGGVVQGIGWALLERMPYDAQGQLLAATLDGLRAAAERSGAVHRHRLLEVPSDHGPFGAKGVGRAAGGRRAGRGRERRRRRHRAAVHRRSRSPRRTSSRRSAAARGDRPPEVI